MVPRPVPASPPPPLIPQYFAGRELFITGATGFMGKVLVERLLWTCRDIARLHLLLRRKRDVAPEKRLAQLKESQVFDVIREHCPHQLDKLSVLAGDVTRPRFGLDDHSISQLNQVSVVFHSAATVKFDEPLAVAVEQNVRPVITLMDICDQLPDVQVLIYVSTAYSNVDLTNIEERVYPAPANLNHVLALVDALPQDMLKEITPKVIAPKPNTYTFTKAMAESAVAGRAATAKYATAIFRPTAVVSALRHPFPGWIENLHGPSGAMVGTGKGVLHALNCAVSKRADLIPVDICIDTLIAVAWETAVDDTREARVYNCSSYECPTTWGEFRDRMERGVRRDPFDGVLWYPFIIFCENSVAHKILETSLQTVPLYAMHYASRVCGLTPRPSLSTVCKRLHAMNEAVKFFTVREWHFSTENVQRLRQRLSSPDAAMFNLDPSTIDWEDHCVDFVKGTRRYLLREKDQDIKKAQRRLLVLRMVHSSTKLLLTFLLCRLAIPQNHLAAMVPRPVPASPTPPLIPQYFAGRELFITGATGFMGKVLVERLLWKCRDISRLHLLMRRKRDVAPEKRLAQLKEEQVFDVIREHCPHQLDKLSVLAGDVTRPRFGLDDHSISQLNQVSVVFHSAATLKFDEPLAVAVEQNVRSVITLMDICDQLPDVQVLIYVSTAYSNADLTNIEECVYPAPAHLNQVLALVDALPQDMLKEITQKLIAPKPNTYTFTKAMAESAVAGRAATAKYANAIFRPTIVVSALRHPFPGWIENLNGPSGAVVGAGKGILHTLNCSGSKRADLIPVDMCIDTLIAVAWETAVDHSREARVYNCSSYECPTTWGEFRDSMVRVVRRDPFDGVLWYPFIIFCENSVAYKILETSLQTVPLYAMHYASRVCGLTLRPSLSTVCKRMHAMNEALKFFAMREWHFSTENVQRLRQRLSSPDAAVFNLDPSTIDWKDHCADFVKGTRRYLLREKDQDIKKAQRRLLVLRMVHNTTKLILTFLLCRLAIRTGPAILRTIAPLLRLQRKG